MKKLHFVITAGPTAEPIDPVRIITNRSTGIMGYEIALEALKRKHRVTLISGPVCLEAPKKAKVIHVETAAQMKKAVDKAVKGADCLIMAAAVADFRVEKAFEKKIKKKKELILKLKQNPDILGSVKKGTLKAKVGFALETDGLVRNAEKKMAAKGLDMVIANKVCYNNDPFGNGKKGFTVILKGGKRVFLNNLSKRQAACAILDTLKNSVL